MAGLQRGQLRKLCSSSETYDKAEAIFCLASAKTRPGSGFAVDNPVAIPAVCAYLASEQLNTGEVSLQSAMSAACVARAEFERILKKIRAALHALEGDDANISVTYATLVDAYHIHPREAAIACMEDAEAALPRVDLLRQTYSANVLTCAVFDWVCQLMDEPIQQRTLCHVYAVPLKQLKAVVTVLEKQCGDEIADQISSHLLAQRNAVRASVPVTSPVSPPRTRSPMKSATKPRTTKGMSVTPTATPSKKRTVAFGRLPLEGDDGSAFPETPSKRRRVDASSPEKPARTRSASSSPTKRSSTASTAAFYAALRGSPVKPQLGVGQEGASLDDAGPSTPRRSRHAKAPADMFTTMATATPAHASPSRAQPDSPQTPRHGRRRRRFRPVFLEQQQWCARDPKVERMWSAADAVLREMVGGSSSFSQVLWSSQRVASGAMVGVA